MLYNDRVFGTNMKSRASRRRYQSSSHPKWWGRKGHLHWMHRGIPLRLAEKYTSWWGSYVASFDRQRGVLWRRQTDRADDKYGAASLLTRVTSQVEGLPPCKGIDVRLSGILPSSLVKPTGSFVISIPADPCSDSSHVTAPYKLSFYYYYYYNNACNHIIQCTMPDYSVWRLPADQVMNSLGIHQWSAGTGMWYTYAASERESYRDPIR